MAENFSTYPTSLVDRINLVVLTENADLGPPGPAQMGKFLPAFLKETLEYVPTAQPPITRYMLDAMGNMIRPQLKEISPEAEFWMDWTAGAACIYTFIGAFSSPVGSPRLVREGKEGGEQEGIEEGAIC